MPPGFVNPLQAPRTLGLLKVPCTNPKGRDRPPSASRAVLARASTRRSLPLVDIPHDEVSRTGTQPHIPLGSALIEQHTLRGERYSFDMGIALDVGLVRFRRAKVGPIIVPSS
jgi:hypothetical protein